ncbi:hypothetical protein ACFX15_027468 [Malus domestica]
MVRKQVTHTLRLQSDGVLEFPDRQDLPPFELLELLERFRRVTGDGNDNFLVVFSLTEVGGLKAWRLAAHELQTALQNRTSIPK